MAADVKQAEVGGREDWVTFELKLGPNDRREPFAGDYAPLWNDTFRQTCESGKNDEATRFKDRPRRCIVLALDDPAVDKEAFAEEYGQKEDKLDPRDYMQGTSTGLDKLRGLKQEVQANLGVEPIEIGFEYSRQDGNVGTFAAIAHPQTGAILGMVVQHRPADAESYHRLDVHYFIDGRALIEDKDKLAQMDIVSFPCNTPELLNRKLEECVGNPLIFEIIKNYLAPIGLLKTLDQGAINGLIGKCIQGKYKFKVVDADAILKEQEIQAGPNLSEEKRVNRQKYLNALHAKGTASDPEKARNFLLWLDGFIESLPTIEVRLRSLSILRRLRELGSFSGEASQKEIIFRQQLREMCRGKPITQEQAVLIRRLGLGSEVEIPLEDPKDKIRLEEVWKEFEKKQQDFLSDPEKVRTFLSSLNNLNAAPPTVEALLESLLIFREIKELGGLSQSAFEKEIRLRKQLLDIWNAGNAITPSQAGLIQELDLNSYLFSDEEMRRAKLADERLKLDQKSKILKENQSFFKKASVQLEDNLKHFLKNNQVLLNAFDISIDSEQQLLLNKIPALQDKCSYLILALKDKEKLASLHTQSEYTAMKGVFAFAFTSIVYLVIGLLLEWSLLIVLPPLGLMVLFGIFPFISRCINHQNQSAILSAEVTQLGNILQEIEKFSEELLALRKFYQIFFVDIPAAQKTAYRKIEQREAYLNQSHRQQAGRKEQQLEHQLEDDLGEAKAAEEREEPRTESDKYPLGKTVAGRVRAIATFFWQNGLLRGQPDELRLALVGLIISQRSVEAANLVPGNFWNQAREDKLASLLNDLKVKNKAGRCLNNDLEFQKDFLEKLAPLFTPADILCIIKQISALQLSQTVLRQIYSDAIASSEKQNAKAIDWLSNISNRVFGGQEVVELLGEDLDLGTGDDAFAGARSRRPSEGNRGEEDSNDGDAFAGARRPLLTVWQRTKNSQTSSVATARSARMLSPPSLRMPEERRPLISHESSKSDGSATIISSNG